jgi:uncharacterized protein
MKSSQYNIYLKEDEGYILYNSLTSAAAQIDEETKYLLEENPDSIPENFLNMFLNNGFVVEDQCDEKKIFAYRLGMEKYNIVHNMLSYTVAMTYACNLACPYCYEGTEKDVKTLDDKKVDILLKNINKNMTQKDFSLLKIVLYGGEPLIAYNQCVQLMEGISRICDEYSKPYRGNMLTNGVLITEDVIDTLLKPYCSWVQITMDGGREAHNKRRIHKDGSGTYDTLLGVLELLRDKDMNFSLNLNVDKENVNTFAELSRDLKERGFKNLQIILARIHSSAGSAKGCASFAEKCFSYGEMKVADKVYEQISEITNSQKSLGIPKFGFCQFDRGDQYTVDPYLYLYKCAGFVGQKDMKVGFIDENGETVFNYEYYEQMSRNPLEFKECSNCKYLPICVGGCAAQSYLENGTYYSSLCKKHKDSHRKYVKKSIRALMEKELGL